MSSDQRPPEAAPGVTQDDSAGFHPYARCVCCDFEGYRWPGGLCGSCIYEGHEGHEHRPVPPAYVL